MMKRNGLVIISMAIVLSMTALPIAMGYASSSVSIGENRVNLEEEISGGIVIPPDDPKLDIKTDEIGGHPGFWIYNPDTSNDYLLGTTTTKTFDVDLPANRKFVILAERPDLPIATTYLKFTITFAGDETWTYYADNKDASGSKDSRGIVYYSAGSDEYLNGSRLIPQSSITGLEFMEFDRDIVLTVDSYRGLSTLRLAIIFE
jgi:hypothetical protein